jgi:hypothetical protein
MNKFTISATSDRLWNRNNLLEFLIANQHQQIELTLNPEAICLRNLGVYDLLDLFKFEAVHIHTWNPLEQHNKYHIHLKGSNFWFTRTAKIDPALHDWDLSRRFLCFYHRPTAARLGLAGYLKQQYPQHTIVHFSTTTGPNDLAQFEFDKLLDYDVPSVAPAVQILKKLPLLQNNPSGYTATQGYFYNDTLTKMYKHTLVDIVVESHVAGNTFFPTEKTVRAILLKRPFVIFGSCNYLEYLRQMGFRTFSDFWSEDYDGYVAGDRLRRMYQTIDIVANATERQLEKMYWDMQYTLDHNYDLLMTQSYNRTIKEIT